MSKANLNQIDLHIHSTCSDGQYSITELLNKANEIGLKYIGIVDHDTVKNFSELQSNSLAAQMRKEGAKIYAGTEFSCIIDKYKLHLIGYNFNYTSDVISNLIEHIQELRKRKLIDKLEYLQNQGIYLKEEQINYLKTIKNVGKPHIAKCMIENGVGGDVDIIIKKYLNNAGVYRVQASSVIEAVHKAKGFVVIAHPYQIAEENHVSISEAEKVWEKLTLMGVDGMECFYSKYDASQINYLVNFANAHNLLITFGSDFHGERVKPDVKLGCVKKN